MTLRGTVRSVQVGPVGAVPWRGDEVPSAIGKAPVEGPVAVGALGLAGDAQADLVHHGGPDKAVCCFASEHVPELRALVGRELPAGAFGENLTLVGLTEDRVRIGDVFAVGTAAVQVSQPRGPCFKLAARWGLRELPAVLARSLRAGFYVRVLRTGAIAAGDAMVLERPGSDVTVAEVLRVTYRDRHDPAATDAVLAVPELADAWRRTLETLRSRRMLPLTDPVGDA